MLGAVGDGDDGGLPREFCDSDDILREAECSWPQRYLDVQSTGLESTDRVVPEGMAGYAFCMEERRVTNQ